MLLKARELREGPDHEGKLGEPLGEGLLASVALERADSGNPLAGLP